MHRVAAGLAVWAAIAPARADNPPIVDRHYAIDLYDGVALGDTAMVAMGGAGAAWLTGTAGALINPSAISVRPTTDQDGWSVDYHLDFLTGRYSSDYDNNGVVAPEASGASLITGGLGLRIHNWSAAVTVITQTAPIPGTAPSLTATATSGRIALGHYFAGHDLAVGAALQVAAFSLNEAGARLFEVNGTGLAVGATWVPALANLRVGGAIDLPIVGGSVTTASCDPMSCRGYILPDQVEAPARIVGGVAYRLAATAWNQLVATPFRDEQALTLAADVVLTGTTTNGYGLEAFGVQQLQRSGRTTAVSLRGGAEFEWLPGRLRVRAGSYWEPPRFDGVPGRLHGTVGVELGGVNFEAFGPRRLKLALTADVAARYRNLGLSIGFWH
jgi:hypothetical protein